MAEDRLYDNLLSLPLFQGMSRSDLALVAGQTLFDFRKYNDGKLIAKEGDACRGFYFLLKGKLTVESASDDYAYRVVEDINAPEVVQPEHLFGLKQRYTRTYITKGECNVLFLNKTEVMKLASQYDIFRLNLLNIISTQTQKANHRVWRMVPEDLRKHVIRFFESHSVRPAGDKMFYIKMNRLAQEVNDSRLDVSKALNEMQEEGLLELYRGRIHIPALEKLLM